MKFTLKPIKETEKSSFLSKNNVYTFLSHADISKYLVKSHIESFFNVQVESVNSLKRLIKSRKFKNSLSKKSYINKFYIKLKSGFSIEKNQQ